jgi:hypothetical protein
VDFISSSASIVPRLAQNPISGDASHGVVDKLENAGLNQLQISSRSELPKGTPEIFASFAWGDDLSDNTRKRTEIVDRLCEALGQDGWKILRMDLIRW